MSDVSESAERQRFKEGVFQPGQAQIAREMKCRLGFCDSGDRAARVQRERPH